MKRLHIHIKTNELDRSIRFYTAMFGKAPDRLEADYAKWLLDDPAANVSITSRGDAAGVDHVGISLDTREELEDIAARLEADGAELLPEEATTCCYAQSNKYWARDPQGAVWELFQTFGDSQLYGADPKLAAAPPDNNASCCPTA